MTIPKEDVQSAHLPEKPIIAAVIPCYKVTRHIGELLSRVGPEVNMIICVDDACPEGSGKVAQEASALDNRISVIFRESNGGVGAATITGYKAALRAKADILIKLDGDGQMDPALIPHLVAPIASGRADFVKGNRFYNPEGLSSMPPARLWGNAVLSFLAKLSTGYWSVFDPNNGFTAVHADVCRAIPLDKLSKGYFFESDMLGRLNIIRAVVEEMPMDAQYGKETSSLSLFKASMQFPGKHMKNFCKRIFYNYFLRNFNMASLNLLFGSILFIFGSIFGAIEWIQSIITGRPASSGTVMLSALPVILGVQLLLSFLSFDVSGQPIKPIHQDLREVNILSKQRAGNAQ